MSVAVKRLLLTRYWFFEEVDSMRFFWLIQIFKERMAGANLPLAMLVVFILSVILLLALWRWGAGIIVGLVFCLIALQFTKSDVLTGLVLMGRFAFVATLLVYALLSRKNGRPFSPFVIALAFLPTIMLLNSFRGLYPAGAFGHGLLFLSFYGGLILGGRKILGDARGRATFIMFIVLFTIVMTCLQIPFWSVTPGRFQGFFEKTVGFMIVGMAGVIVLFWFGMKKRACNNHHC